MRNVCLKLNAETVCKMVEAHINKTVLREPLRVKATGITAMHATTVEPNAPNLELMVNCDVLDISL